MPQHENLLCYFQKLGSSITVSQTSLNLLDFFAPSRFGRENVQGLGANQIGACIMDGPKSIRNMSKISEVSKLGPKFEYCFYRNIANF